MGRLASYCSFNSEGSQHLSISPAFKKSSVTTSTVGFSIYLSLILDNTVMVVKNLINKNLIYDFNIIYYSHHASGKVIIFTNLQQQPTCSFKGK